MTNKLNFSLVMKTKQGVNTLCVAFDKLTQEHSLTVYTPISIDMEAHHATLDVANTFLGYANNTYISNVDESTFDATEDKENLLSLQTYLTTFVEGDELNPRIENVYPFVHEEN